MPGAGVRPVPGLRLLREASASGAGKSSHLMPAASASDDSKERWGEVKVLQIPSLLKMGPPPEQRIGDDEELTHYGTESTGFRDAPREKDQDGLSLIRGHVTVDEACSFVRPGVSCSNHSDCRTRYTTAKRLRQAGFIVSLRPSKRNALHVRLTTTLSWADATSQAFNLCFGGADE
jgi:hypothetical protein